MFESRAKGLNGNHDFGLTRIRGKGRYCLLIFGPQPGRDGFLDIGEGFLLRLALRNASRQGRTLRHNTAALSFGERYVKYHVSLSLGAPCVLPHPTKRQSAQSSREPGSQAADAA